MLEDVTQSWKYNKIMFDMNKKDERRRKKYRAEQYYNTSNLVNKNNIKIDDVLYTVNKHIDSSHNKVSCIRVLSRVKRREINSYTLTAKTSILTKKDGYIFEITVFKSMMSMKLSTWRLQIKMLHISIVKITQLQIINFIISTTGCCINLIRNLKNPRITKNINYYINKVKNLIKNACNMEKL